MLCMLSTVLFTLYVNIFCFPRFANNYICALTETVKSIDTGLPPNLPVLLAHTQVDFVMYFENF